MGMIEIRSNAAARTSTKYALNTFYIGAGIDELEPVDHHPFGVFDPPLFVSEARNQACRQCRSNRIRSDVLLCQVQRFSEIALRGRNRSC
jgi:hypothetical protein